MNQKNLNYFDELFGAKGKVLESVLEYGQREFSKTELENGADVAYRTAGEFVEELKKLNLIVPTREIGKTTMYQINQKNPFMLMFDQLYDEYKRKVEYIEGVNEIVETYGGSVSEEDSALVSLLENKEIKKSIADKLLKSKLAEEKENKIVLTPKGKDIANAIKEFIEAKESLK